MGHAHHFLSRLDRVSLPHVELALSLYRDESLLRFIIESAKIPPQTPRLAVSLDHPTEGPFLVVTRDGKFVTCLGAGMSPGDLPIIPRGQLDALATKVQVLREGIEEAKLLAQGRGVRGLVRRIYDVADDLTREEFMTLSALQPLYGREFLQLYIGAGIDLDDARKILIPILRKTEKPKAIYRDSLHSYWKTFWAMGHFAMLAGVDGANGIDPGFLELIKGNTTFSWPAVRQGIVGIACRGLWATARIGKPLLSAYRQRFRDAKTMLQTTDTAAGILAIGARHSRLRAEADKTLNGEIPEATKESLDANVMIAIRKSACLMMEIDSTKQNETEGIARVFGATLAVRFSQRGQMKGFHFKALQDVPDEISRLLAINNSFSYLGRGQQMANVMTIFLSLVPLVARSAPQDLYFPREIQRAFYSAWEPEMTLDLLRELRDHVHPPGQHVRSDEPTRKGPCPCGSGKKYKRCCGEGKSDDQ